MSYPRNMRPALRECCDCLDVAADVLCNEFGLDSAEAVAALAFILARKQAERMPQETDTTLLDWCLGCINALRKRAAA